MKHEHEKRENIFLTLFIIYVIVTKTMLTFLNKKKNTQSLLGDQMSLKRSKN